MKTLVINRYYVKRDEHFEHFTQVIIQDSKNNTSQKFTLLGNYSTSDLRMSYMISNVVENHALEITQDASKMFRC